MADNRKAYIVNIGGRDHTMLLDDDDAERYGSAARPVAEKSAPKPANKARTPKSK